MTPLDLPGTAPRASAAAPNGERGRGTVAASDAGQPRSAAKGDFETLVESEGEERTAPAPAAPEAGTKPRPPLLQTDIADTPPKGGAPMAFAEAPDPETVPDTESDLASEAGTATVDLYPETQGPETPAEASAVGTTPAQSPAVLSDPLRATIEPARREADAPPHDAPTRARSEPPPALVSAAGKQPRPTIAESPTASDAADVVLPLADVEPEPAAPVAASPSPSPMDAPAVSAAPPGLPTPMVSDDLALAPRTLPGFDWRLSVEARPHGVRLEATPTSTAQPQAVAGQLTAAIVTAKDRQIEIRLDPPELGRVQIQLDQTETGLRAVVMAERPETHDLLRRHAELLQRELAGAGYRNVDLGFAAGGQTDAREGEARGGRLHGAAATAALPVPPPAAAPSRSITGGLDIRL